MASRGGRRATQCVNRCPAQGGVGQGEGRCEALVTPAGQESRVLRWPAEVVRRTRTRRRTARPHRFQCWCRLRSREAPARGNVGVILLGQHPAQRSQLAPTLEAGR
eukprot:3840222-Rhodomonas_salina.2